MTEIALFLIALASIPGVYIFGKARIENKKNQKNIPPCNEEEDFNTEEIYSANVDVRSDEHLDRSKLSLGELLYSYKKPGDASPDFEKDEGEYHVHSVIDLPLSENELSQIRSEYNLANPEDPKYTSDDMKIIKNAINRYVELMFSDSNLYKAASRLKKGDLMDAIPLTVKEFNSSFKKSDETFRGIYLNARMDAAAEKLNETRLELIKIQFMAGYSDAESFRNAFKARHKKTPSEFKELTKTTPSENTTLNLKLSS